MTSISSEDRELPHRMMPALLFPLLLVATPSPLGARDDPVSWDVMLKAARSNLSDDKLVEALTTRGLNFDLKVDHLREIRRAGRSAAFLERLVNQLPRSRDQNLIDATTTMGFIPIEQMKEREEELELPEEADPLEPKDSEPDDESHRPIGGPRLDPGTCATTWESAPSIGSRLEAIADQLAGSELTAAARLETALGFLRNGFPASACVLIGPLLGVKTDQHDYACALLALSEIRREFDCPVPDPIALTDLDPRALPANAAAIHAYLLGRDLMDLGAPASTVLEMLRLVSHDAPDYPAAVFFEAVLDTQERNFKTASKALMATADIEGVSVDGASLRDLSLLNLARIAFENNYYDVAGHLYLKVSPRSRVWLDATRERAYAHLFSQNDRSALGAVVALEGFRDVPFADFPDMPLIRVLVLMDTCHFAMASRVTEKALDAIQRKFRIIREFEPLMVVLEAPSCDDTCRRDMSLQISPEHVLGTVPAASGHPAVRRRLRALLEVRREIAVLQRVSLEFANLDPVLNRLTEERHSYRSRLGGALLDALASYRNDLISARSMLLETQVDLMSAEKEWLEFRLLEIEETHGGTIREEYIEKLCRLARRGLSGKELASYSLGHSEDVHLEKSDLVRLRLCGLPLGTLDFLASTVVRKPSQRTAMDPSGGDTRVVWDFHGEYWQDELNGIRVELPNRCEAGMVR